MSIDKVLHKIQLQIKDIAPNLEFFVEHTIQPTVDECDKLHEQLSKLQEDIVIYRYLRLNRELSPSFNLHSKISEVEVAPEKVVPEKTGTETPLAQTISNKEEIKAEIKKEEPVVVKEELKEAIIESIKPAPEVALKPISIAINDKFRFINELFAQNGSEYNIAIEQLNTLKNWHDAEVYLNSLRSLYVWKEHSEIVKYFYAVVKKRFA